MTLQRVEARRLGVEHNLAHRGPNSCHGRITFAASAL
jgi:hypothetical protein